MNARIVSACCAASLFTALCASAAGDVPRFTSMDKARAGAHDSNTGLDPDSFSVTADFAVNGIAPGENPAAKCEPLSQGLWALILAGPVSNLDRGRLTVTVKDKQGIRAGS